MNKILNQYIKEEYINAKKYFLKNNNRKQWYYGRLQVIFNNLNWKICCNATKASKLQLKTAHQIPSVKKYRETHKK